MEPNIDELTAEGYDLTVGVNVIGSLSSAHTFPAYE